MPYYVYTLCDPRTGHVCYVGMTRDPQARMASHRNNSGTTSPGMVAWVSELAEDGLTPRLQIVGTYRQQIQAQIAECVLISVYAMLSPNLLNIIGSNLAACVLEKCKHRGITYKVFEVDGDYAVAVDMDDAKILVTYGLADSYVKARAYINVLLAERHESKAA